MREMKDSGVEWIGEVPRVWRVERFKGLAINVTEPIPQGPSLSVPLENVEPWTGKLINAATSEDSEGCAKGFCKGDVLFSKLRPYLAKVFYAPCAGACSGEMLVLRPKGIDSRFLSYYLMSPSTIDEINGLNFGTKMPRADWNIVCNLKVPLPSINEQRRIVSYLDERCTAIDEDIAKRREAIEKLKEYKRAYISCVISEQSNRLRKTPHQSKSTLKHIASRIWDGPFGSHLKSADYIDRGVRVIRLENLRYMQFNDEKTSYVSQSKYESIKRHTVRSGDLIISTFISDEVKVAMLPDGVAFAVNKADCIGITPCKGIYNRYLQYALSTHDVFNQLKSMVHGSTRDRVNCNQIKAIKLPVPSEKAQVEIVKELDSRCSAIDEAIACQERLIGKLEEYRKSIIHYAVTGKIDCMGA